MDYAYWAAICPSCKATVILCEIGPVAEDWQEPKTRPAFVTGSCPACQSRHTFLGRDFWVDILPYRLESALPCPQEPSDPA